MEARIIATRTIILTGATGYLGRRILSRLLARGDRVIAIVRDASKLDRKHANLSVVQADIRNPLPSLGDVRADALVHAAACVASDAGLEELMRVNRDGTRHVTLAALRAGVTRAVLVSSSEASGPAFVSELPVPERTPSRPADDYGRSKLASEEAFTATCEAAGVEPTILRPCNILGPDALGFAGMILEALRSSHPMLREQGNDHPWQPIHVLDVVEACLSALRFGGRGVYHVTDGTTPTLEQLARHASAVAADFGMAVSEQFDASGTPPARAERVHWGHASTRAFAEWNWSPTRTFPQTIIEIAEGLGLCRSPGARPRLEGPLRVMLVNTPSGLVHENEDRLPPLDLLSWIARLEQVGWPVELADGSVKAFDAGDLLSNMAAAGTDAVVCQVGIPTFETDLAFLRQLRRQGRARVIANIQLTHPPFVERLLLDAGVDFVIFGECDLTIERVIAGDDHRGTARLAGGEVRTVPEEKLQDLDRLPHPARHVLSRNGYFHRQLGGEGFTTIESSRGGQGAGWRARSPWHVVDEIESAFKLGYRNFLFCDATFMLSRRRTVEICEMLVDRGLPITFWCETRIDGLDDELLALLAKAGCKGVNGEQLNCPGS